MLSVSLKGSSGTVPYVCGLLGSLCLFTDLTVIPVDYISLRTFAWFSVRGLDTLPHCTCYGSVLNRVLLIVSPLVSTYLHFNWSASVVSISWSMVLRVPWGVVGINMTPSAGLLSLVCPLLLFVLWFASVWSLLVDCLNQLLGLITFSNLLLLAVCFLSLFLGVSPC